MFKIIYIILILAGLGMASQAFTDAENINQQMFYVILGCFFLILARLMQAEDMRPVKDKAV